MHDHNLDDLIIDNNEPKNRKKTKSFLTIVALFIVVLIVAIVLTKILLKEQNPNAAVLEEDNTEFIAPELKLQEKPIKEKEMPKPSLQQIIEDEPISSQKNNEKVIIPKPIVREKKKEKITPPKTEKKQIEAVEKVISDKIEKPIIDKPIIQTNKIELPPIQETTIKKPTPPKEIVIEKYYVQVGSFKKDPSTRFLSVIKNSGFKYQVTKTAVDGTKKLLIGPYKTRVNVDKALVKVRDRINKSAFVVKK